MKNLNIAIFFVICLSYAACKKNKETLPPPDEKGIIWLRNIQSLSLIKKTLKGNWKIHYQYGGLTGNQKIDMDSSWFRYLPNDSIYFVISGKTYAATKANFIHKETQFGYTAWLLDFEINSPWQFRDELVVDLMASDSLWLVRNSPDPVAFVMTRKF